MFELKRNSQSKGLTLLEMVFAMFLFAILVPLFAGIWPIHRRAVTQSQAAVCGNHICREVLEEAISSGYDGVDTLSSTPLADRTITLTTERTDSFATHTTTQDFVWSVSVETDAEDPSLNSGEKLVKAKVDWTDRGAAKEYSIATLLAESP